MNVALKPQRHELVLTRELAAPRARVFAAWTELGQAAQWWAPQGFETLSCEMDVRPGGIWRRRLRGPNGIVVKHGVYREVSPPERLVFTYMTDEDYGSDAETVVTVTLEDLGGRTRLTLRHAAFDSEADRLDHEGGWSGAIERLLAFVDPATH